MIPEITLTLVPCNFPDESCSFCVTLYQDRVHKDWCRKWRVQRDKETVIYGCNPDYPEHFK